MQLSKVKEILKLKLGLNPYNIHLINQNLIRILAKRELQSIIKEIILKEFPLVVTSLDLGINSRFLYLATSSLDIENYLDNLQQK